MRKIISLIAQGFTWDSFTFLMGGRGIIKSNA